MPLGRAAQQLAADPVVAAWLDVGLSPDDDPEAVDRELLRALLLRHPRHAGHDRLAPAQRRPFASREEIAAAQRRLAALASRLQ